MKLLTSTILFLTVSTNLFSQTPQTLLQKARVIMEKEIKDNADDPWSYRFTSIDSCFDDTKYKKIDSYIGNIYDKRRYWKKDSLSLSYKMANSTSVGWYNIHKRDYDEGYQKMVQTDSLYNVLLNSTDKPVVVRIWLNYRIKNTSGGYEKRTEVIYYHTKLKKFAWNYYIRNISDGFEDSDL